MTVIDPQTRAPAETIGLIAGGGQFPLLVAEAAKRRGLGVVAVAHLGETDPSLSEKVDEVIWIRLGQLGQLIKALKKRNVKKGLMAGTITKRRMFEDIRPDLKGLAVISKLALFHDDGILRAVADELAREGIEIVSSTQYLPELVARQGCLTKRKPNKSEKEDIDFGFQVAKELGRLDIGQCVVVKKKTILAVEAIEGTDAAIRRGGDLALEGAVVVKVSKPNQDLRFDVPAVGLGTVKTMGEVKAAALAVESGKTLLFDKDEMITYADKLRIAVVSV
jgi:UDP-2,3-diacylglucosamine hydrolase